MVNAQQWLDQNYPPINRNEVGRIYLTEPNLEGNLDLSDFNYNWLRVYIYPQVDESKLIIKKRRWKDEQGRSRETEIIKLVRAQEYIQENYPTTEERRQVTNFYVHDRLEGYLDLSDFNNLQEMSCADNKLTVLNLNNCDQLEELIVETII